MHATNYTIFIRIFHAVKRCGSFPFLGNLCKVSDEFLQLLLQPTTQQLTILLQNVNRRYYKKRYLIERNVDVNDSTDTKR